MIDKSHTYEYTYTSLVDTRFCHENPKYEHKHVEQRRVDPNEEICQFLDWSLRTAYLHVVFL